MSQVSRVVARKNADPLTVLQSAKFASRSWAEDGNDTGEYKFRSAQEREAVQRSPGTIVSFELLIEKSISRSEQ